MMFDPLGDHPKPKVPYTRAMPVACRLWEALRPACEQIEIVGSVRRKKPYVSDIELLVMPSLGGFMQPDPLAVVLDRLIHHGLLGEHPVKDGQRWKRFTMPNEPAGFALDLFIIPSADEWGVCMALKTGPAVLSKAMVTPFDIGGLLRDGYRVGGDGPRNRVWECGTDGTPGRTMNTAGEQAFFEKFIVCGWIDPVDRERIGVPQLRERKAAATGAKP